MKNTETEFGRNKKVAFILSRQRGERVRLMPQDSSLHKQSRGLYKARAYSQEPAMRGKGDKILISSSCIVSKTVINWSQ